MALNTIIPDFARTLKTYRLAAKLSQEELAHRSGLDRTYISMLERGVKSPTLNTVFNLCDALEVNFSSMARHMCLQNTPKSSTKSEVKLPLMGSRVACGTPVGDEHFVEKEISLEKLLIKHPENTFFVQASGDSMAPVIQNNDFLIIDKEVSPKSGQIILAQVDNEFTVKRYFKEGKTVKLKAENPQYSTIEINENQKFIFCGLVISVIKNNP